MDFQTFNSSINASQVVFYLFAQRNLQFAANLSGSGGLVALVAATASATFNILHNGTSIGSAVFAADGTVAAITTSAFTMAAGDTLEIQAPATADATLSGLSCALTCLRLS
jgi:hypothetical protein